jgi:hypothetical protein
MTMCPESGETASSRKTVEMDPNFAMAHNQLAQAYLQQHLYKEAVVELQKTVQLLGEARRASLILLTPTLYPAGGTRHSRC